MKDRYAKGRSTPRPIRYNDRLWEDFAKVAAARRLSAADLIRGLMAEAVLEYRLAGERSKRSSIPEETVVVELELD